ncbi:DUF1740-domain-containing protein [Auriculariales sp. MPI-PUGE-AT-0066]|nr:DUF1740-domain-containing protein [Auriculariales sp. MPI-PUGE-AT-0066]
MSFPSFDSFPSLDPGPSSQPDESALSKKLDERKDSDRKRERGYEPRDDRAHRDHKREREHSHSENKGDRKRAHSSRDKSSREHKDRHRSSKHETSSHRDRDRQHDTQAQRSATRDVSNQDLALFVSDRRGDKLNITYGSLHASSIPRFRRKGKDVFGAEMGFKIIHESSKGVEVGLLGRRPGMRYVDRAAATILHATEVQRLVKPLNRPLRREDEETGFIPLSNRAKPTRTRDKSFQELLLDGEDHLSSTSESEISDHDDDNDETTLTGHTADQEAIRLLEETLVQDPTSLTSWHSLLAHSLASIPIDSKNARKVRGEITLSVLSRALAAHDSNGTSARFRALYLHAGESVWSADKLTAEWETALRTVRSKAQIYLAWFNWRLKVRMRAGDIASVAEDASRTLRALDGPSMEIARVGVILRSARFFIEAGYHERGIALFQAQIELAYFCPETLRNAPLSTQLSVFEEFWDSEVPRMGEDGATGWVTWMQSPSIESDTSARTTRRRAYEPASKAGEDHYAQWYEAEVHMDKQHNRPLRTTDESDDPYATILLSDIRAFLSIIRTDEGRWFLLHAFLAFLGLHIPDLAASFDHSTSNGSDDDLAQPSDGWILPYSNRFVSSLFPESPVSDDWDVSAGIVVAKEDTESKRRATFGQIKEWPWKALHPLVGTAPKGVGRMWETVDTEHLDHEFIDNVFTQMSNVLENDDDWDTLHIAFQASMSTKSAAKLSKSLLAKRPDSLVLWTTHALLEQIRGRNDEARAVLKANLIDSSPATSRPGAAEMWWHWANLEWMSGDVDRTKEIILASCDQPITSGVGLLKAKRTLDDRITASTSDRRHWICLRALFELIVTSNASFALEVFVKVNDVEEQALLDVCSSLMLHHFAHTLRNPCPAAVLRTHAETTLGRNPENTVVLGCFIESQRGQWSLDRNKKLRSTQSAGGRPRRLVRTLWDIWNAGQERGEYAYERLRQSLNQAANQPGVSPLLWKIFLALECHAGTPTRAKNVMFRGTGDCPWSKDLYLPAFGPIQSAFKSTELSHWAESMVERGVRLRQELDIFTQNQDDHDMDDGEDLPAVEAEIEHRAHELRRLMPY